MKVRRASGHLDRLDEEGESMDAADVPRPAIVSTAVAGDAGAAPPSSPAPPPLAPLLPPPGESAAPETAPPTPAPSAAPASMPAPAAQELPPAPPPAPAPSSPPPARQWAVPGPRSLPYMTWVPREPEKAPLELGIGTFFWVGGAAGGYIGVAPFLYADLGKAVFLRPSIAVGTSVATNVSSTLAAARIDTCFRYPGRYAVRGGMQLDLCGGVDAGFSYVSFGTTPSGPGSGQTIPLVDIGPSVDLRAEAGDVGITLRVQGGFNVAQQGYDDGTGAHVDLPIVNYRLEMAISWVMRRPAPALTEESGSL